MSQDENTPSVLLENGKDNLLKKILNIIMICVLMAPVVLLVFGPPVYFVSTPHENIEQQQEAMDNSGYNWTEVNYTTFETEVSCGFFCTTTIAEEQCANGIQEACEYVTIKNVDYHDRNFFQQHIWGFGAFMVIGASCIALATSPFWLPYLVLVVIGGVAKKLGWEN